MDSCRFDNWTRMFGARRSRRAAFAELAVAGGSLLTLARFDLGLAAESDVPVADCRLTNDDCTRDSQCCSQICEGLKKKNQNNNGGGKHHHHNNNQKRTGTCRCLRGGQGCTKSSACCRGQCDPSRLVCT